MPLPFGLYEENDPIDGFPLQAKFRDDVRDIHYYLPLLLSLNGNV